MKFVWDGDDLTVGVGRSEGVNGLHGAVATLVAVLREMFPGGAPAAAGEWVAVAERCPPNCSSVLVASESPDEGTFLGIGTFMDEEWSVEYESEPCPTALGQLPAPLEPAFWMPLPKPPKTKKHARR